MEGMAMKSKLIVSVGVAGALLFGSTQVDWNGLATKAAIAGGGTAIAQGLLHKGSSGTNIPPIINNKAAKTATEAEREASKTSKLKSTGKAAAGLTVVGAGVLLATEAAKPALEKGANELGEKLDEPLNENDDNQRDAYCASMPSIQSTSGCK
jgi:hypothetical protein